MCMDLLLTLNRNFSTDFLKWPLIDLFLWIFNPFVLNAPFFYLLKTSETLRFSDAFRG